MNGIDWGMLRIWSIERFVVSTTVKTSKARFAGKQMLGKRGTERTGKFSLLVANADINNSLTLSILGISEQDCPTPHPPSQGIPHPVRRPPYHIHIPTSLVKSFFPLSAKHTGGDTLSLCLLEPPFHQLTAISAILISRRDGKAVQIPADGTSARPQVFDKRVHMGLETKLGGVSGSVRPYGRFKAVREGDEWFD